MKSKIILMVVAVLLLVGCEYKSPLTQDHSLATDAALLGLWELASDEPSASGPDHRMMILPFSDTEYLIQYPTGEDGIYYRGYPIKIGGRSCIQLQVIGVADRPLEEGAENLFHVVSTRLTNSRLEIKILNTDVVDRGLKTTDELAQAFLDQKDNAELFDDPEWFRKVKKSER